MAKWNLCGMNAKSNIAGHYYAYRWSFNMLLGQNPFWRLSTAHRRRQNFRLDFQLSKVSDDTTFDRLVILIHRIFSGFNDIIWAENHLKLSSILVKTLRLFWWLISGHFRWVWLFTFCLPVTEFTKISIKSRDGRRYEIISSDSLSVHPYFFVIEYKGGLLRQGGHLYKLVLLNCKDFYFVFYN